MYLHLMIIHDIMKSWKDEAKIRNHIILYKYDRQNKVLKVYTDKPGPLIGIAGTLINKYESKLREFDKDIKIHLKETDGLV